VIGESVAGQAVTQDAARRRGRRPVGEDARGAILAAAREEFAERGFEGTAIRGVARRAGVDARLVHHYFDSKEDVFVAAFELPYRPQDVLPRVLAGGPDGIGERLVRIFFSVWDTPVGSQRAVALLGAAMTSEQAARMLREFLAREVLGRIAASLGTPDPELRASLAASQMGGVILLRYVLRVEPLASAPVEDVVPLLAPTVQRYLAG